MAYRIIGKTIHLVIATLHKEGDDQAPKDHW